MFKLSSVARRKVFQCLCRASLARHLARSAAERGDVDQADYYRSENRHFLSEARALVGNDLFVQLKVQVKEVLNAPTQVSATAAFQQLRVLCVLRGNSLRNVAQGHNLPRLHAPWAAPECGRSMALPAPNAVR